MTYYTEEGRFSIAAKYQKEIAEHYESENDLENALEAYEAAADFYEGEGSTTYVLHLRSGPMPWSGDTDNGAGPRTSADCRLQCSAASWRGTRRR